MKQERKLTELGRVLTGKDELLEKLAAAEHESWADWMKWLFERGIWEGNKTGQGRFIIDQVPAERWFKLAKTPYEELDEPTKQFDRDEVKRIKPLLDAYHETFPSESGLEGDEGAMS